MKTIFRVATEVTRLKSRGQGSKMRDQRLVTWAATVFGAAQAFRPAGWEASKPPFAESWCGHGRQGFRPNPQARKPALLVRTRSTASHSFWTAFQGRGGTRPYQTQR